MKISLWAATVAMCACIASLAVEAATSEPPYPARPIRVIVPQAPGGTVDLLARVLGDRVRALFGVVLVVDDRPGANAMIGNEAAKRAPADGYTLLAASTATHVMTPLVLPGVSYDPVRDFVPVVNLVHQTKVILVTTGLGVSTLAELTALARSRPGQLNFASAGVGSSSHLDTVQLAALTGMELVHIPYRGSAQSVAALMANEVQVLLASITAAQPALASGRARALAVLSDARSPLLPDVPTLVEAGLPGLDVQTWIGIVAPAGTAPSIVDSLNAMLNRALRSAEVSAWLDKQGLELVGGTPEAFDTEIRADLDKWDRVVRRLGIRAH
jgi:tripartite-type tricarboxylate transporter receptor subunit TctC